jgi:hypothetical protein
MSICTERRSTYPGRLYSICRCAQRIMQGEQNLLLTQNQDSRIVPLLKIFSAALQSLCLDARCAKGNQGKAACGLQTIEAKFPLTLSWTAGVKFRDDPCRSAMSSQSQTFSPFMCMKKTRTRTRREGARLRAAHSELSRAGIDRLSVAQEAPLSILLLSRSTNLSSLRVKNSKNTSLLSFPSNF